MNLIIKSFTKTEHKLFIFHKFKAMNGFIRMNRMVFCLKSSVMMSRGVKIDRIARSDFVYFNMLIFRVILFLIQ